jgi:hypothetical protein
MHAMLTISSNEGQDSAAFIHRTRDANHRLSAHGDATPSAKYRFTHTITSKRPSKISQ